MQEKITLEKSLSYLLFYVEKDNDSYPAEYKNANYERKSVELTFNNNNNNNKHIAIFILASLVQ